MMWGALIGCTTHFIFREAAAESDLTVCTVGPPYLEGELVSLLHGIQAYDINSVWYLFFKSYNKYECLFTVFCPVNKTIIQCGFYSYVPSVVVEEGSGQAKNK